MSKELQFKSSDSYGFEAAEALDAYIGVILNSDGKVETPTSAGQRIIGVTRYAVAAGEIVEVFLNQVCPVKVKTASGLSVMSLAGFHTDGGAYRPATSSGLFAGARLLQAPVADGDIVSAIVDSGITATF